MKLMGAGGVALAISISAMIQVTLLYTLWNRRSKNIESREVYRGFVKMILICIPIGIVLEGLRWGLVQWRPEKGLSGNLLICFITGFFFLVLLFSAGYYFKIREITGTFRRLLQKAI
jgi:putative peptidoglycan lipid II flippase